MNKITLAHLQVVTHISGQYEANLVLKDKQTGLLINVLSANVQTLALDRSYKDNKDSRLSELLSLCSNLTIMNSALLVYKKFGLIVKK